MSRRIKTSFHHLVPFLAASFFLTLAPKNAIADTFWTFVQVNCDSKEHSLEIKQIGLYNEAGEAQYKAKSTVDESDRNGIYSLDDLLIQKGKEQFWKMKALKKRCQLKGVQTLVLEVKPSKFVYATGRCGGEPPNAIVSIRQKKNYLVRNLELGEQRCSDHSESSIKSVTYKGDTSEILVSGRSRRLTFNRIFPATKSFEITAEKVFTGGMKETDNPDLGKVTDFFFAARDGDLTYLKMLLDQGVHPNSQWELDDGATALIIGLRGDRENIVEELLERNVDVNQSDDLGNTPLMIANAKGNQRLIALLKQKGAR